LRRNLRIRLSGKSLPGGHRDCLPWRNFIKFALENPVLWTGFFISTGFKKPAISDPRELEFEKKQFYSKSI
jgi:hypothetical protein